MRQNDVEVRGDHPARVPCSIDNKGFLSRLRALAIRGLGKMYQPDERLFVFSLRGMTGRIRKEGLSRRYTAIALIGLAEEKKTDINRVLQGDDLSRVCDRLKEDVARMDNLGDVALTLWAAFAIGDPDRQPIRERLVALVSGEQPQPIIELSWALAALCLDPEEPAVALQKRLANRLVSSFMVRTALFPHVVGHNGLRSHIACFADLVYPIHALAHYFRVTGEQPALEAASRCAEKICQLQGDAGQWWWHYDRRTGEVFERYPVYAIHQDAMAPMALFALREAGGPDCDKSLRKGLDWLAYAPEIGGSLIDDDTDLVWRKVTRRGTGKLFRSIQAVASRMHPAVKIPRIDALFPPTVIDYEDRPYHLGWLLYAWPLARVVQWEREEAAK